MVLILFLYYIEKKINLLNYWYSRALKGCDKKRGIFVQAVIVEIIRLKELSSRISHANGTMGAGVRMPNFDRVISGVAKGSECKEVCRLPFPFIVQELWPVVVVVVAVDVLSLVMIIP